MLEKITKSDRTRQWTGNIPVEYIYTAGVAGEAFLRRLKDRGHLLTSRCPQCQLRYLPARLYCERCLAETEEYEEIEPRGRVHAFTAAHLDLEGQALNPPHLYAFVSFPSVGGGMVHRLGEVDPESVSIGMAVEAVLLPKEDRAGSINDIAYFRPCE